MGLIFGRKRRSRRTRRTHISVDIPLLRWLGPLATVAASAALLLMLVSGRIDLQAFDTPSASNPADQQPAGRMVGMPDGTAEGSANLTSRQRPAAKSNEVIRIASFNAQKLSSQKLSSQKLSSQKLSSRGELDPTRVAMLGKIISRFDVVALQGLRGGNVDSVKAVIDWIRASGGNYVASISDPVGPPGQAASCAFLWDESRLELSHPGAQLVHDPADRMRYEPMFGSFETRVGFADGRNAFRFTLINVWAVAPSEQVVLENVFLSVRDFGWEANQEEDYILLGEFALASAESQRGGLGEVPGLTSVLESSVSGSPLQPSVSANRIMLDPAYTAEYTGRCGQVDLQVQLKLSPEERQMFGADPPVWAEFGVFEVPRLDPATRQRTRVIR